MMTTEFEQAYRVTDTIYEAIRASMATRTRMIVAIDGRCAAGKSTVAQILAERLQASLIHMDDFFLRPSQRTPERLATPGENIDHERFLQEVLLPLKENRPFTFRPFLCWTQSFGDPIQVTPTAVTIIEGSYACHPSLREHYDLRVFLTVDPEEQMERIRKRNRDYATVFRDLWIPLEETYFRECAVRECCDLLTDTSAHNMEYGIEKSRKY